MTDAQRHVHVLLRRLSVLSAPEFTASSFTLAEQSALVWALAKLQPILERQNALENQR